MMGRKEQNFSRDKEKEKKIVKISRHCANNIEREREGSTEGYFIQSWASI